MVDEQSAKDEAARASKAPAALEASEALAQAWPRALIASGRAPALASWWCASRAAAARSGLPAIARHAFDPALGAVLFEARRSRRLKRGLEDAAAALETQARGLEQAPAARVAPGGRRISRLLVLSADGSARFYGEAAKLCRRHVSRLESIVLECDEQALGEALFGRQQVARAVLLDHKDAVLQLLEALTLEPCADASSD